MSRIRHLHADRAQADHTERTARQLVADETLLALLDRRFQCVLLACQPAHEIPGFADVPRRNEQPREHQLLHRIRIRAGRGEDGDAALRQQRHGYVVGPGARATDRKNARRNLHRVHIGGPDQDGIGVADLGGNFIAVARQAVEPLDRNAVQREDPETHELP